MYISLTKDEGIPPLEFLYTWSSLAFRMDKEKSLEVIQWEKVLNNWEYRTITEYDKILFEIIKSGYINLKSLNDGAEVLNAIAYDETLSRNFSNAWRMYHDTFENNEEDFIKVLTESFKAAINQISVKDLDVSVGKLRELNRDDLAEELISFYMSFHRDINTLDISHSPWRGEISDKSLLKRFELTLDKLRIKPSLTQVIQDCVNGYINPDSISILREASEDDFYNELKKDRGERNLGRIVKTLLEMEYNPELEDIALKVRATLRKIGGESLINESRMKYYPEKVKI